MGYILNLKCELAIWNCKTQKGTKFIEQDAKTKQEKKKKEKMQRIFLIKNIYDYNYIEQFLYILPFLGQLRNII